MRKRLTETEKKEYRYLLKVISACVNGTKVPSPYEGINWEKLIELAEICSLESIFANTVLTLDTEDLPPKEIRDKLVQIKNFELLLDGNLHYEIEKLLMGFDELGVKNVPLKGYFMKQEYAQPDFRSVSDFDILFDINELDKMKQAFENLGYTFLHSDDNQYHFQKLPCMYLEMHATLVHEYESYFLYLKDQIDRCTKREGYDYSYEMSVDDYYLYMLVHNSNHLRLGGMGIRMVLDTYVYYKNHKDDFNFEYLNECLKSYGLDKYEKRVREIAFNWFSTPEPKLKLDDFETFILFSRTLGRVDVGVMLNAEKHMDNGDGTKKSRISYLFSSVFPNRRNIIYEYPYLEKLPFLLPVAWLSIWWKRLFINKNVNFKQGLKNRLSYTDDDFFTVKRIFKEVGFEKFDLRQNKDTHG